MITQEIRGQPINTRNDLMDMREIMPDADFFRGLDCRPIIYLLDDNSQPVPVDADNFLAYLDQHAEFDRWRVAEDWIDDVRVSTVFLGIDHGLMEPEPILFETMVFGGKLDDYTVRYTTWHEAEVGHKVIVDMVKEAERVVDA